MRYLLSLTVLSLVATTSCSWWTRFDDLKDSVPVVEIPSPGGILGFSTTMATVPTNQGTRLMVLGEANMMPKGAVYDIVDDDPSASPTSSGFCTNNRCLFGDSPAPLRNVVLDSTPHASCFVLGVGHRNNTHGLVGSCADGTDFVLSVPEHDENHPEIKAPRDLIEEDLTSAALGNLLVGDFKYDASNDDAPLIVASTKHLGAAWFYPPKSTSPIVLSPVALPGEDMQDPRVLLGDTFGSEVAVASLPQGGHLIAIASPRGVGNDLLGRVWLYRILDGKVVHDGPHPETPAPVGCLPGFHRNFGIHMHTGKLFQEGGEQLLISDGETISIYDAGVLAQNPPTSDCGGPPLGASGYMTSVGCVETGSVTGCPYVTAGFGRAVAMADVDGNGTTELLVGVPTLEVGGTQNAGAILVYEVDPEGEKTTLLEARIISSRDGGDALGTSVAGLRIGSRDVIAAGAPGIGSFFLFYCSTLGGEGRSSSRCR